MTEAEETADAVVVRARERADELLAAARAKTDRQVARVVPSAPVDTMTARTRVQEDQALREERATADEVLREERAERHAVFSREREETDEALVTERAQADHALARRDEFLTILLSNANDRVWTGEDALDALDALMEHIPEGVTIADAPDVRIRRVSRYGTVLLGRSRDAVEGQPSERHLEQWNIVRPDGTRRSGDDLPLTRATKHGEVVENEEWCLVRSDGDTRTVLCNAAPIRDPHGTITGGLIAWRDVTERKRGEQQLKDSEQKYRELAVGLAEVRDELVKRDRQKDDFIAILSHELRNPLAPISYAIPVLQRASLPEPAERALGVIVRQTAHLSRLVDDLLDVSRLTAGKLELRRDYLTLQTVAKSAREGAGPAVAAGEHLLTVVMHEEPLWVYGDAARLAQVVVNLLDNAAKYTPPRGHLQLAVEREGDEGIIRVRDNGRGIPPDALKTIFEMFHQVNNEDSRLGGLGIGLGLVKLLVDLHGGQVEARSAGVANGSEFIVRLPLAGEEFGAEPRVRSAVTDRRWHASPQGAARGRQLGPRGDAGGVRRELRA